MIPITAYITSTCDFCTEGPISHIFFIIAVDKVGVAITSLHLNFAPFYVMILLFLLGEAWDLRASIGASIVAFGVWLAQIK